METDDRSRVAVVPDLLGTIVVALRRATAGLRSEATDE